MSRALETYLVKLYLDRDARRAFLADPRVVAAEAGLSEAEVAELAARSFASKRASRPPRGRWARLVAAWRRRRARS